VSREISAEARDGIRELIRRETACLNDGDLDAWMALFTDDGYYWMPLEVEQQSPDEHDSLIYDNKPLMEIRRNNLGHPLSPSMDFPVRSVRILSELDISAAPQGDCVVRTSVIAMINHKRQDVYGAQLTYRVCEDGDGWRIRSKRVDLINADSPLDTIMIYI
jgi:benzoate/toluate 1,2-dioxygenase beta subunit